MRHRRPLVAGNWKMNGTRESVSRLLSELKQGYLQFELTEIELVVLPPFVLITLCETLLAETALAWGAQDLSEHALGPYTGEISAMMLKDWHCRYVLVGHSERRRWHGETNERVAVKARAAMAQGIVPIVCVGESQEEREAGRTWTVLREQLSVVLQANIDNNLCAPKDQPMIIAYEPLWAIGTGQSAAPEQAQEVHAAIRALLRAQDPEWAERTRILYGGSVKPDTAGTLMAMPDVDGVLVGAASLEADSFLQIGRQCKP